MEKINKYLLLINLFFLQSYLIRFKIFDAPSNLQEILIILQAIIFFITITANKEISSTIRHILNHKIITTFIILTAISLMIVGVENNLDLIRPLKFLFFASMLTFIFIETFKEDKEKIFAIKIAGIGAIMFGIFSVIYNLSGYNVADDKRLLGPLDAAVYLAYYLTPFFIFFAIQFLKNTKNKLDLIFAIILMSLIIATKSMGAIGGSFLVILFFILKKSDLNIFRYKSTKIITTIIGILIVAAIFYSKILPTFQTNYSSLNERSEIWQTSIHLLKDPETFLVGVGFGQFESKYIANVDEVLGHKPLDYYVIQPHNIFLLFIFHYGILGLLFLLIIMYKTIKIVLKNDPENKQESAKLISAFILLYFFIHGLIDTPFFKNDMLILLLIFLETALVSFPNKRISIE